jgi:hypothetical protein
VKKRVTDPRLATSVEAATAGAICSIVNFALGEEKATMRPLRNKAAASTWKAWAAERKAWATASLTPSDPAGTGGEKGAVGAFGVVIRSRARARTPVVSSKAEGGL